MDRPTQICNTCHQTGHYSPDLKLNALIEGETITGKFDALNFDYRARVTDMSYCRVKV